MKLIELVQGNVFSYVFAVPISIYSILSFSVVGKFITNKSDTLLNALLGVGLVSSLISTILIFDASVAKNTLKLVSVTFGLIFTIQILHRVKNKNFTFQSKHILQYLIPTFILILVVLQFLNRSRIFLEIDSHQNYYSGLSFEVIRAEYHSRLRISDNYPLEWVRYHFYSSTLIAIPLQSSFNLDYVSYISAKNVVVYLLFLLIIRSIEIKVKHLIVVCFIFILVFANTLAWSMLTNHILSILFFVLFLVFVSKKSFWISTIFIFIFANCASRNIPAALMIFLFITWFKIFKLSSTNYFTKTKLLGLIKFNATKLLYLIIFFINIWATIFSGERNNLILGGVFVNSPVSVPQQLISTFFPWQVFALLPQGIDSFSYYRFLEDDFLLKPNFIFFLILQIYLLAVFLKGKLKIIVVSILTLNFMMFSYYFLLGTISRNYLYLNALILYYLLPFASIFLVKNKKIRYIFLIFYGCFVAQLLIFSAYISIPAYSVILVSLYIGLLYLSLKYQLTGHIKRLFYILLFVCLIRFGFPISPMKINEIDSSMNTTHLVSMSKIEEIINSEQCKNFNLDFNLVKGYFGERVYYSQYRDPRDSVTKPFISFGSKKIISNVIECRSELNSK